LARQRAQSHEVELVAEEGCDRLEGGLPRCEVELATLTGRDRAQLVHEVHRRIELELGVRADELGIVMVSITDTSIRMYLTSASARRTDISGVTSDLSEEKLTVNGRGNRHRARRTVVGVAQSVRSLL
jgi:hypothetical protein